MLSRGYLATYPCRGTRNTGVVARELLAVHTSRSGTRRLADRSLSLRATNNDGQRAHGEEKELEKARAVAYFADVLPSLCFFFERCPKGVPWGSWLLAGAVLLLNGP